MGIFTSFGEFPTTSMSCRNFQKQFCQLCENNFHHTADLSNISAMNKVAYSLPNQYYMDNAAFSMTTALHY